ncbi:nephrin [Eudromia elegans]
MVTVTMVTGTRTVMGMGTGTVTGTVMVTAKGTLTVTVMGTGTAAATGTATGTPKGTVTATVESTVTVEGTVTVMGTVMGTAKGPVMVRATVTATVKVTVTGMAMGTVKGTVTVTMVTGMAMGTVTVTMGSPLVLVLLVGGATVGVASPVFLEEPSNRSVVLGEGVELRCRVAPGGGAVQWAREGLLLGAPPSPAFPRYRLAGDPRRGEHHLRIAGVALEDDGAFECQAGGANGTGARASRPGVLSVLGAEPLPDVSVRILEGSRPKLSLAEATARLLLHPPDHGKLLVCSATNEATAEATEVAAPVSVTYPPAEVTLSGGAPVAENDSVTVSCASAPSSPPARLRWWLGGRELRPARGGHSQAPGGGWVTVSNVTIWGHRGDHGRTLVCQAQTPGLGAGPSASLELSVTHPPRELWLEAPGPNVTLSVGAPVRLLCLARGGHPPPRLQWRKDGRLLKEGAQASEGALVTRELLVTVAPSDNGATYRCEAPGDTAGASGALGASTRLRVLFPPAAVTITATPRELRRGQSLVLTCEATSAHPAPLVTWHREGHPLQGQPLPAVPGAFGGTVVASRLRLRPGAEQQGQQVTCEATSAALGVTVSAGHRLVLRHPPEFPAGPGVRVEAQEGGGARLPLEVAATPPVQRCWWSRGGRVLRAEGSPRHHVDAGGALTIENVTRGDAGAYGLQCHNAEGTASTRVLLLVHYPPSIRRLPDPVVVDEGEAAELLCEAEGSPLPPGSLRWARLAEASQGPGPGGLPGELQPEEGGPIGRLRVPGARRDLGGPYECRVDTGVPPPARATVRLIVRYAPEMEAAPDPERVLVPDGSDVAALRCRAQGVPGVQLHWERDGRPLGASESRYQEQQWREGPWTRSLLTVANRGREPNGTLGSFACVARNALGSARRRLLLQLADRPAAPGGLRVLGVAPHALSVTWRPGFDGGLPQSFLVSVSGPGAPPPPAAILAPGPPVTVGGLRPATPYDVTVRARNARGDSPAATIAVVTSGLDPHPYEDILDWGGYEEGQQFFSVKGQNP